MRDLAWRAEEDSSTDFGAPLTVVSWPAAALASVLRDVENRGGSVAFDFSADQLRPEARPCGVG